MKNDLDLNDNQPAELQQPHYSRPLGPGNMTEAQLRKLNLIDWIPVNKNQQQPSKIEEQRTRVEMV